MIAELKSAVMHGLELVRTISYMYAIGSNRSGVC